MARQNYAAFISFGLLEIEVLGTLLKISKDYSPAAVVGREKLEPWVELIAWLSSDRQCAAAANWMFFDSAGNWRWHR